MTPEIASVVVLTLLFAGVALLLDQLQDEIAWRLRAWWAGLPWLRRLLVAGLFLLLRAIDRCVVRPWRRWRARKRGPHRPLWLAPEDRR